MLLLAGACRVQPRDLRAAQVQDRGDDLDQRRRLGVARRKLEQREQDILEVLEVGRLDQPRLVGLEDRQLGVGATELPARDRELGLEARLARRAPVQRRVVAPAQRDARPATSHLLPEEGA
mgnify:CR=1 FL=1